MSRVISTLWIRVVMDDGQIGALNRVGSATMFFTACSLGAAVRVSAGMFGSGMAIAPAPVFSLRAMAGDHPRPSCRRPGQVPVTEHAVELLQVVQRCTKVEASTSRRSSTKCVCPGQKLGAGGGHGTPPAALGAEMAWG